MKSYPHYDACPMALGQENNDAGQPYRSVFAIKTKQDPAQLRKSTAQSLQREAVFLAETANLMLLCSIIQP